MALNVLGCTNSGDSNDNNNKKGDDAGYQNILGNYQKMLADSKSNSESTSEDFSALYGLEKIFDKKRKEYSRLLKIYHEEMLKKEIFKKIPGLEISNKDGSTNRLKVQISQVKKTNKKPLQVNI